MVLAANSKIGGHYRCMLVFNVDMVWKLLPRSLHRIMAGHWPMVALVD
jgi:hypothetical protein